eukprot:g69057.t1
MSVLDYPSLTGRGDGVSVNPWRAAAGAVGLGVAALSGWASHRWAAGQRMLQLTSTPWKPFQPSDGVDSVKVENMPPGALQVANPVLLISEGGPRCYFSYGAFMIRDSSNHVFTATAIVQDAWLYGARLFPPLVLAMPTGVPDHILKGRLYCFPQQVFAQRLKMLDEQRDFDPQHPEASDTRRCIISVVRKDGTAATAVWYYEEYDEAKVMSQQPETMSVRGPNPVYGNDRSRVGPGGREIRVVTSVPMPVPQAQPRGANPDGPPDVIKIDFRGMSADEILDTVSKNVIDVPSRVAAWFLLGQAVRRQPRQLVDKYRNDERCVKLMRSVQTCISQLGPIKLSNAWLGARDLQVSDVDFLNELQYSTMQIIITNNVDFLNELQYVTMQRVDGLEPQGLSNIFNALARLAGLGTAWNVNPELLTIMCESAVLKHELFKAQEISNLLNAVGRLGYRPTEEVLVSMCDEAMVKMDSFESQGVANSLNALAKLDYQPGEAFLQAMCSQAVMKIGSFKSQEISNTLNALARLDYHPDDSFLKIMTQECVRKTPNFEPQGIANVLNALARLGYHPSEELLEAFQEQTIRKKHLFEPQHIANTVNAFSKLTIYPHEHVLRALCEEARAKADLFKPQEIANVLNAVAKLGYAMTGPGEEVMRTMCTAAKNKASDFDAQAIAITLDAVAKVELRLDDDKMVQTLAKRALAIARTFKAQEIANTLRAFAQLGFNPGNELLEALTSEALKKAETFKPAEIANTLNGLKSLGYDPGVIFRSQKLQGEGTKSGKKKQQQQEQEEQSERHELSPNDGHVLSSSSTSPQASHELSRMRSDNHVQVENTFET